MKKKNVSMEVVNPNAAGIDIGSRSHYVAIGQSDEDVREFGVYNEDLQALAQWLIDNKIKSVAMESTGTYWQNLYAVLQSSGLDVILCNGKFTKNIKGRKSDVQDCQWIQKLHTLGLLSGSFLPDEATEQLRTYCRHRANLLEQAADTTRKMQKYLRLLNLRLDVGVKDVTGLTGLSIIDAICKGEINPETLASLRKGRVSAISATARKLAVIIWNMVVKRVPYKPETEYQFLDQKRKKITQMKKLITKFDITMNDLSFQL